MFYKPKFCAECGEKVERIEWQPWTSRRFCDDCAAQYENPIRWRTGIAALVVLIIGVGAGQIGRTTGQKSLTVTTAPTFISNLPNASQSNHAAKVANQSLPGSANAIVQTLPSPDKKSINPPPVVAAQAETAYYCGAKTQKGTICTRRVKGAGRCWQHPGKSAMVAQGKLLIESN